MMATLRTRLLAAGIATAAGAGIAAAAPAAPAAASTASTVSAVSIRPHAYHVTDPVIARDAARCDWRALQRDATYLARHVRTGKPGTVKAREEAARRAELYAVARDAGVLAARHGHHKISAFNDLTLQLIRLGDLPQSWIWMPR